LADTCTGWNAKGQNAKSLALGFTENTLRQDRQKLFAISTLLPNNV
jgi:hypothetical protein